VLCNLSALFAFSKFVVRLEDHSFYSCTIFHNALTSECGLQPIFKHKDF
jgi:hypothetical protein